MSYRAHIDQQSGVSISREALAEAGLSIGDTLVVEHVEPGLVRLRRLPPSVYDLQDRYPISEPIGDFEAAMREEEARLGEQFAAKMKGLANGG